MILAWMYRVSLTFVRLYGGGVSFLMSNILTTMPGGLWPDKNFPGKMVPDILGSFYNAEGARKNGFQHFGPLFKSRSEPSNRRTREPSVNCHQFAGMPSKASWFQAWFAGMPLKATLFPGKFAGMPEQKAKSDWFAGMQSSMSWLQSLKAVDFEVISWNWLWHVLWSTKLKRFLAS